MRARTAVTACHRACISWLCAVMPTASLSVALVFGFAVMINKPLPHWMVLVGLADLAISAMAAALAGPEESGL